MVEAPKAARRRPPRATVRRVDWSKDLPTVRKLFEDYRRWMTEHRDESPSAAARVSEGLGVVEALVAGLPGAYGPPRGDVLLWFDEGSIVACGALREVEPGIGEIKRIHVRGDYRGMEFGPVFVRAMVDRARELGLRKVRADALASMEAAIRFYQDCGFRPIEPYWPHPAPGARFFEYVIDA